MIEIKITDQMRERAQRKDIEMGELRNSIKHGKGNEGGFLGEEVVLFYLPHAVSQNTYQHDLTYKGYTFDVKTTERDRTHHAPKPDYVEKISALNPDQTSEFIIFVSLHEEKTVAYITAWMHKPLFLKRARFRPIGDVDPDNGQIERTGSYQLFISELWPPEELLHITEPGEWPYAA